MTRKARKQGGKKQRARAGSAARIAPRLRSLNTQARGWLIPAICLSLLALTWIVFGQTLRFGFVNYDASLCPFAAIVHFQKTMTIYAEAHNNLGAVSCKTSIWTKLSINTGRWL